MSSAARVGGTHVTPCPCRAIDNNAVASWAVKRFCNENAALSFAQTASRIRPRPDLGPYDRNGTGDSECPGKVHCGAPFEPGAERGSRTSLPTTTLVKWLGSSRVPAPR